MTIEGYFDGTAVRTLEPVDLKPNQWVLSAFWTMIILTQKNSVFRKNLIRLILFMACFLLKSQRLLKIPFMQEQKSERLLHFSKNI